MDDINKLEPVAPSVEFVTRAGSGDPRTADHALWLKDLEERKERTRNFIAKREAAKQTQDFDLIAELDAALVNLEAGATDFESSYGKPNQPLIDSKLEVERLRSELALAESRLAEIENRGDSVTRLVQSVTLAEGALNGLLRVAEEKAIRKLVTAKFGWEAPMHKIQRETLRELALDISVQSLRQFAIQQHREQTSDVAVLQQRMDAVGRQLAALREHLEPETA